MDARGWRHAALVVMMAPTIAGQVLAQGYQGSPGQPVFLSGHVVLEDGTPPPELVVVEKICAVEQTAAQGRMGRTDSTGYFSFSLGENTASLSLDAQNQRSGQMSQVPGVAGSASSEANFAARKEARTAYENGRALAQAQKLDEARKEYEEAVEIAPKFASAWFELGLVHEMQHDAADARQAYGESLLADPRFVKPYRQLAVLAFDEQKWEEVVNTTDRLFGLDPVSYPDAYFLNAFANFSLNRLDAAEQSAREVVRLDSERAIPRARWLLGAVLIEKKDYAGAAEQLRNYVEIAKPGPEVEGAKEILAQLEARLSAPASSAP